ncbi:hypothetical protein ACTXG7_07540 [Mycolicibacterium sp. Dal123E01]|uniref:hypothetical protein n=1 Tax=Mycolicibacterium sp. Dal123E01 TaxID=3457578 RepID=UPI00403ED417
MGRWGTALLLANITAVGLAAPAVATDDITQNALGTYQMAYSWGPSTWVATPCDDDADQCIKVSEFSASDTAQKKPRWTANAYWSVGSWIVRNVNYPGFVTCKADGSTHDLPMTFSWDAANGNGNRSYFNPGICDDKAGGGSTAFTLTKIGPPPAA